jgi:hypothetical protein
VADYSAVTLTVALADKSDLGTNCAASIFYDMDEEAGTETIEGELAWGGNDVCRDLESKGIPYYLGDDGCYGNWHAYEEVFDGKNKHECDCNLLAHMSSTGKLKPKMQKRVEAFCRAKAAFYKRAKKLARKAQVKA